VRDIARVEHLDVLALEATDLRSFASKARGSIRAGGIAVQIRGTEIFQNITEFTHRAIRQLGLRSASIRQRHRFMRCRTLHTASENISIFPPPRPQLISTAASHEIQRTSSPSGTVSSSTPREDLDDIRFTEIRTTAIQRPAPISTILFRRAPQDRRKRRGFQPQALGGVCRLRPVCAPFSEDAAGRWPGRLVAYDHHVGFWAVNLVVEPFVEIGCARRKSDRQTGSKEPTQSSFRYRGSEESGPLPGLKGLAILSRDCDDHRAARGQDYLSERRKRLRIGAPWADFWISPALTYRSIVRIAVASDVRGRSPWPRISCIASRPSMPPRAKSASGLQGALLVQDW